MSYSSSHKKLVSLFDHSIKEISIPGSDIRIANSSFISDSISAGYYSGEDRSITENITFSYPVFVPADKNSAKVILLLHGLNERNWSKYLTWAYRLASETGQYVILFPISFHVNRSPLSWRDPRSMLDSFRRKKGLKGNIPNSSFANITLSDRLSDDPRRFLKSGYQTLFDLVKLITMIKNGKHEIVPAGSTVNIFAYSIGAFLAQIMMMADPGGLLSESRMFMFCGGSVFSNMRGESKFIMDKNAFDLVYRYYLKYFETELKKKKSVIDHLVNSSAGMSFRSMIDYSRFRTFREKALSNIGERIYSIGLAKDKVIPSDGIVKTLKGFCNVEVWDFPHYYIHENPFPLSENISKTEVDYSFDRVFRVANGFLKLLEF